MRYNNINIHTKSISNAYMFAFTNTATMPNYEVISEQFGAVGARICGHYKHKLIATMYDYL